MNTYKIGFITPLFSVGAFKDNPEIRPSSIRGQLHWWFRALGGDFEDETQIFGGIARNPRSSKVVVRVANIFIRQPTLPHKQPTLPHKIGGDAAKKPALESGVSFDLQVLYRYGGLNSQLLASFERTVEAWLTLGSLGLRANRGSGAFDSDIKPNDLAEYKTKISRLIKGSSLYVRISKEVYRDSETARGFICDTLNHNAFAEINYPLGLVKQKDDNKNLPSRKTSPLKLTVRAFNDGFRIVSIWDGRSSLTNNRNSDLDGAITILENANKPIGKILRNAERLDP